MFGGFVCFLLLHLFIFVSAKYPCGDELRKHRNFHLVDHGSNCGQGNVRQAKIMNGGKAGLGEFPWVVYIRTVDFVLGTHSYCTGSLVNERYVVSAAHCYVPKKDFSPNKFFVALNMRNIQDYDRDCEEEDCDVQIYRTEEVLFPPPFNSTVVNKDIALLRLVQKVPLNNNMRPVCLPVACDVINMELKEGYPATTAGWGYLSMKPERMPTALMKANLFVTECSPVLLKDPLVLATDWKVCVSGVTQNKTPISMCPGDSGSPLMFDVQGRMVLAGVGSTNDDKCEENLQGVSKTAYTKVFAFMSWLLDNIRP